MTTKPSLKANKSKVTKPSKVIYVPTESDIKLASEAGEAKRAEINNKEAYNTIAKQLKEKKAVIGDARTCPLAKAFLSSRFTGKVAASTKANALNAFRKSVETGKEYTENATREEKKKAAKKTGAKHNAPKDSNESEESADEETKFTISIAKRGSAEKAAKEFRKLVNKMKESEEYANLALLLIDAIDEFEGTEI